MAEPQHQVAAIARCWPNSFPIRSQNRIQIPARCVLMKQVEDPGPVDVTCLVAAGPDRLNQIASCDTGEIWDAVRHGSCSDASS